MNGSVAARLKSFTTTFGAMFTNEWRETVYHSLSDEAKFRVLDEIYSRGAQSIDCV